MTRYIAPILVAATLSAQTPDPTKAVDTYCSTCHTGTQRSASTTLLERIDVAEISSSPDLAARAYREIQAGTMPPWNATRPDPATANAMLASIAKTLDTGAKTAAPKSTIIAARLATLLWNSAPDASLQEDAQANRLTDPATLERQIHRMLADDRAQTFVSRFFFPWLSLDQLGKADPDKKYFPDYDPSLRDALTKETQLFLLSQLRDDRDPVELWTANYTFLNEQLAKNYDIPNVTGPDFRRVELTKPERFGLLGQGSIHMATSRHTHGNDAGYTTPATRGRWIHTHFLGTPTPGAAPNAQPVKPELPITPQTRNLPMTPCVTCHNNFFPLGYGLENFDGIGRYRTQDTAGPVDASGILADGTKFNNVVELRKDLMQRPDAFRTTITEALISYTTTGSTRQTPDTLIHARRILSTMPQPRWSALIAAAVTN